MVNKNGNSNQSPDLESLNCGEQLTDGAQYEVAQSMTEWRSIFERMSGNHGTNSKLHYVGFFDSEKAKADSARDTGYGTERSLSRTPVTEVPNGFVYQERTNGPIEAIQPHPGTAVSAPLHQSGGNITVSPVAGRHSEMV